MIQKADKDGRRFGIAMVAWAAMASLPAAAQTNTGARGDYIYSYVERVETAAGDLQGETTGTISIARGTKDAVVYMEQTPLRPGCGAIPAIEWIGNDYAAFCGNLGGRHYTKKLFKLSPMPAPVAQLDYFDSPAKLVADADGKVRTLVLRRDIFGDKLTGPHYFPLVYTLASDGATTAFAVDFKKGAQYHYQGYFNQLKKERNPAAYFPEMLAALIATGDRDLICGELKKLKTPKSGLPDLQRWLEQLATAGYPRFDTRQCKGA